MTLLFNAATNISESKKKLIREILKSNNAEMLQELYWLIREENQEEEGQEENDEEAGMTLRSA